jgi:hypothetical protein
MVRPSYSYIGMRQRTGAGRASDSGAGVRAGAVLPVAVGLGLVLMLGLGLGAGLGLLAGLGWAVGCGCGLWCGRPGVPAALAGGLTVAAAGASVPTRMTWLPGRTMPAGRTASTLPGGSRLLGRHRTSTVRPR